MIIQMFRSDRVCCPVAVLSDRDDSYKEARAYVSHLKLARCPHSHWHPDSVAVFLEDQKAKMTHPDGKSEEMSGKKGEAIFTPAGAHLPENIGTGPIEVILVELKKPAAK